MRIMHLTASTFFGGPERQLVGLARALPREHACLLVSFWEHGKCLDFLSKAAEHGLSAVALCNDSRRPAAALREIRTLIADWQADVLLCHGYKANLLGLIAARRRGIPAVAVSRGWTAENLKVKLYEALDRLTLRRMDHVVSVSEGQRRVVVGTGVPERLTSVIHNSIVPDIRRPDLRFHEQLRAMFGPEVARFVGAAGRLSPEKGFGTLVRAASVVAAQRSDVGFVLFGDGALRDQLREQIDAAGLQRRFVLAGFRKDVDEFLPFLDALVLPSYREGLPNVILEAFRAGVPVVATAVGGTPELVFPGETGYLVRPDDADEMAQRLLQLLADDSDRRRMGRNARKLVETSFTFGLQMEKYSTFLHGLLRNHRETRSAA
jgi:glycosyltransferase involved in cell wall biosynthesis